MSHIITEVDPTFQPITRYEHILDFGRSSANQGGTSDIWKGMVRNSKDVVAVKLPLAGQNENAIEREAKIWALLNHPNIGVFQGICDVEGRLALVTSWYSNGSVNTYLRERPSVNPRSIINEITQGVAYLHARGIVHGDLKGDNIMIDDDGHAKLIDFGQSHILRPDLPDGGPPRPACSLRWCAPEFHYWEHAKPTYAADVYSWACTVLELLTGQLPHADMNDRMLYISKFRRPVISPEAIIYQINDPNSLCQLLQQCWGEKDARPSIEEIKNRLEFVL